MNELFVFGFRKEGGAFEVKHENEGENEPSEKRGNKREERRVFVLVQWAP